MTKPIISNVIIIPPISTYLSSWIRLSINFIVWFESPKVLPTFIIVCLAPVNFILCSFRLVRTLFPKIFECVSKNSRIFIVQKIVSYQSKALRQLLRERYSWNCGAEGYNPNLLQSRNLAGIFWSAALLFHSFLIPSFVSSADTYSKPPKTKIKFIVKIMKFELEISTDL